MVVWVGRISAAVGIKVAASDGSGFYVYGSECSGENSSEWL